MPPGAVARRIAVSSRRHAFAERILAASGAARDSFSDALIQAFSAVPREEFIDSALAPRAHEDNALPIGRGQTISKPSTVARMLYNAEIAPGDRVLEIGVGCGYVCALLSTLGAQVFGIERLSVLAQSARSRLDLLGYQEVLIRCADGARGWREMAPFDVIVVSAAFDQVPEPLFDQLSEAGGRLVAPVADASAAQDFPHQRLKLWRRKPHHNPNEPFRIDCEDLGQCQFVIAT
jgi:protein-L-isoaspartate(D-aspartate) O-methyltransferase